MSCPECFGEGWIIIERAAREWPDEKRRDQPSLVGRAAAERQAAGIPHIDPRFLPVPIDPEVARDQVIAIETYLAEEPRNVRRRCPLCGPTARHARSGAS